MKADQKSIDSMECLIDKKISFLLIPQEKLIELKQSFAEYQKTIIELKNELQLKSK
jgi:hypothetical protein